MKKLLFTCDGDHFPHSLFALAESTKKQEKILLKGFFSLHRLFQIACLCLPKQLLRYFAIRLYDQEGKLMNKSIAQFEDSRQGHHNICNAFKHTGLDSLQVLLDEICLEDMIPVQGKNLFSVMDSSQPIAELNKLILRME
jgi:hypothetical protein